MSDFDDQRTEQPTPSRRREWRRRGHVARSAHLVSAVVLLGASITLVVTGRSLAGHLLSVVKKQLESANRADLDPLAAVQDLRSLLGGALLATLPLFAVLLFVAAAASVLQVGLRITPQTTAPTWSRIDPLHGLRRMISTSRLLATGMTALKAAVMLGVVTVLLIREMPALSLSSLLSPVQLARHGGDLLGSFALKLSAALCVTGLLDFAARRWHHARQMRMTRAEARDDQRQAELDPRWRRQQRVMFASVVRRRRPDST